MDIRLLEYFVSVAGRRSYKKAAEDLYITRQALSKAIKNLELETGTPLLVNKGNRIRLTEAGNALYVDALPVLKSYHDFEKKHLEKGADSRRPQTLSIAMTHGTSITLPETLIDTFRQEYPHVFLTVEEVTAEETTRMVEQLEAEIGLIGSLPQLLSRFDYHCSVRTDLFVFVPRSSKLAEQERLYYKDLGGQPFVTFGKKNHLHNYFAEECKRRGVEPDFILMTSDVSLLVRTAVQQEAFFFGFSREIEDIESESHVLLPLEGGDQIEFGTYAIKRKGAVLTASARRFWEYLATLS